MRKMPEVLATIAYLAVGALWTVFCGFVDRSELVNGLLYVAPTGLLVFFLFDLSELREARARIESLNRELTDRNHELEIRNRDLAAFSYSISHDLRAPVRAVSGFSEILSSRYGEHLPEEARHYLDSIATAGERMNRMIDDLLLTPIVSQIVAEFGPALQPLSGTLQMETGVGLVSARRAAETLGGSLAVGSSSGEGTTLVLTLQEAQL